MRGAGQSSSGAPASCNGNLQGNVPPAVASSAQPRASVPAATATLPKAVIPAVDPTQETIYGMKKRCLYAMVILSGLMALINLALSVWIIKVLDLSSSGMGPLSIQPSGLRINSDVEVFGTMFARYLSGPPNRNLQIESGGNVTISAFDPRYGLKNRITLGNAGLEAVGKNFVVRDDDGEVLFKVDSTEVLVAAEDVSISNSGGLRLDGSLETTLIRGDITKDLRLESPRKMVKIQGDELLHMESRAGQIKATSLQDIKLEASNRLVLDNLKLQIKNLATSQHAGRGPSTGSGSSGSSSRAKQLCSCDNGRLFLAPPDGLCQAKKQICDDPSDKEPKKAYL